MSEDYHHFRKHFRDKNLPLSSVLKEYRYVNKDKDNMALTIQIGKNAVAKGLCCIAFGDDIVARGAFEVEVGPSVTLPVQTLDPDAIAKSIAEVEDLRLTYAAMAKNKRSPPDFGEKAERACTLILKMFRSELEKRSKPSPEK
jgi:hypothetical protein